MAVIRFLYHTAKKWKKYLVYGLTVSATSALVGLKIACLCSCVFDDPITADFIKPKKYLEMTIDEYLRPLVRVQVEDYQLRPSKTRLRYA